jgi:hypothetical protein
MAQEVAEIVPDAVARDADGYLRVDYVRLGMNLQTWDEWTGSTRPVRFQPRAVFVPDRSPAR